MSMFVHSYGISLVFAVDIEVHVAIWENTFGRFGLLHRDIGKSRGTEEFVSELLPRRPGFLDSG